MDRQYVFERGTLEVDGRQIDILPHWWLPEDRASVELSAPIAPEGLLRLSLPYDRGAYLNESHRARLARRLRPGAGGGAARHRAIRAARSSPTTSTRRADPWPVPVLLVAPKDVPHLRPGAVGTISLRGAYRHGVAGRNIVARLDRGRRQWLVVSTPVTSWFTSTCERGPGIAGFLAMARLAQARFTRHDIVFVATSGHEIGHGGMAHFMRHGAPPPKSTAAWAHFGASLACRDPVVTAINSSVSLARPVERAFAQIEGIRLIGEKAAIGELRDVHAANYPYFFGMAGSHKFFHTPADDLAAVDQDLLAPMARAFADALSSIP